MGLGTGDILNIGAGISSFLGGRSNAKAQKEQSRRQAQLLDMQNQNFRQAQPYYQQALQQAANYAGLGGGVTGGDGHFQLGAQPGQNFGVGGNWGNQEDQLRLQAAEEDINRRQRMAANQLRFNSGRQGLNEGAMGANLARLAGQGQQEYGQFRRGLAINAGQEQERRLAALQNLISQGFGQGSQAAAGYGQQAGMYGQQANQNYSDLGSLFQNYQYKNQLADLVKKRKELKWWDEDPVFGE